MSEEWKNAIIDAEELSPFAISTRYPGEEEEVSKEEALRAIELAEKVREVVRETLRKPG